MWAGSQRKFRPCSFPWCSAQAKACTSMALSLRKDMEFQAAARAHSVSKHYNGNCWKPGGLETDAGSAPKSQHKKLIQDALLLLFILMSLLPKLTETWLFHSKQVHASPTPDLHMHLTSRVRDHGFVAILFFIVFFIQRCIECEELRREGCDFTIDRKFQI